MPQRHKIQAVLQNLEKGNLDIQQALDQIIGVESNEFSTLDTSRQERTGLPETIFGLKKTTEQLLHLVQQLNDYGQTALVTRVDGTKAQALCERFPDAEYSREGNCFLLHPPTPKSIDQVGILCAGTSDLPVLEEARLSLKSTGHIAKTFVDIGVAGLHRLLSRTDEINECQVLLVIAGMEGALASVAGGLFSAPIIAVPTSVGYGAHLGGIAPLLGMLNSCAPGVSVVNIDNGYGAAIVAARIMEQRL